MQFLTLTKDGPLLQVGGHHGSQEGNYKAMVAS